MIFACPLDELDHWLQRLELELFMGSDRRHVLALSRLCEVFADKVRWDKHAPQHQLARRLKLSTRWLDLKRSVDAPPVRRVGKFRVIQGGRAHSGSGRR